MSEYIPPDARIFDPNLSFEELAAQDPVAG